MLKKCTFFQKVLFSIYILKEKLLQTDFNRFQPSIIVTKSSILDISEVQDPTLIADAFALQNWILINFKSMFPSNRNQLINLKDKEDELLLCDGTTLISSSLTKQLYS